MDTFVGDGREEKEVKSTLAKVYDVIDLLDFSMVVLVVAYVVSTTPEIAEGINAEWIQWLNIFFDHFAVTGLPLYLFSLGVCVSAVVVSIMLRKEGSIGKLRFVFRFVIWAAWIPIDLFFIFSALSWIG